MRVHSYAAGAHAAVTHPDVAPELPVHEAIHIEIAANERAYLVGQRTEIDLRETVEATFTNDITGVIVHPCHSIKTSVSYSGIETHLDEHPADMVASVRRAAIEKLKISSSDAVDLVLRLSGSTEDLPPGAPLGAYTAAGTCSIALDLVHKHRPQG